MDKNLKLEILPTRVNEYILSDGSALMINQDIDFAASMAIVESVIAWVVTDSTIEYEYRKPVFYYWILKTMSNVELSDTIDLDMMLKVCSGEIGEIIEPLMGQRNIISEMNQLIDNKIRMKEMEIANRSEADNFFRLLGVKLAEFDVKKLNHQISKINPDSIVKAYTKTFGKGNKE